MLRLDSLKEPTRDRHADPRMNGRVRTLRTRTRGRSCSQKGGRFNWLAHRVSHSFALIEANNCGAGQAEHSLPVGMIKHVHVSDGILECMLFHSHVVRIAFDRRFHYPESVPLR